MHREEAEDGRDHHLRERVERSPNQLFVIGAKAMIGIALAAIA